MGYVTKIKVAGQTLHLGCFSRKSERIIVFKRKKPSNAATTSAELAAH